MITAGGHCQLLNLQADNERQQAYCGHIDYFGSDTVVVPRGHSKTVLLTLFDRKPRFFWDYLLKSRVVLNVNEALSKFIFTVKGPICSITVDRGAEFSRLDVLETKRDIRVYPTVITEND